MFNESIWFTIMLGIIYVEMMFRPQVGPMWENVLKPKEDK